MVNKCEPTNCEKWGGQGPTLTCAIYANVSSVCFKRQFMSAHSVPAYFYNFSFISGASWGTAVPRLSVCQMSPLFSCLAPSLKEQRKKRDINANILPCIIWISCEWERNICFLFCVHKCDFTPLDISLWFHLSHFFFFFAMRTVCLHWTDKYDFFLSMSTISATILCFKNAVNLKMSNAFKCWLMVHWSKLKRGYLRLSSGQL